MNVLLINKQDVLPLSDKSVERLVHLFLEWKGVSCDEVTIHFVTKEEISHLHQNHFNDPSPTDCISFPIDSPDSAGEGYRVLGEVFVCPEVGIEYGGDPYAEVSLYVVHGLLHLLGFDDIEEEEKKRMRDEEKAAMLYLEKSKGILHA